MISEKEHQLLLDAIKEHAIFMIDNQGIIISWNDGAFRLKGFEEVDVLGKHYRMLFQVEDQKKGSPEMGMKEALEKGKFEEDWWRMRKDGSRFWAHVILQPIYDDNDEHIGFAKITSDITAQKRINELNTFLMNESAGYAFFLLDKEGKIAQWSKAAETIIGFNENEAMGKSLSLFYVPEEGKNTKAEVAAHLHKALGGRYEDEAWKVRKDASQFWAGFIISPLHNNDGYVVMIRDLTERRAFEQEKNLNKELAALNKQLERFSFLASHDLKEPVRKISIFCHKLKPCDPEQEQVISKILNACGRVVNLLNDILELSLMITPAAPVRQDLNPILCQALSALDEEIRDKGAIVHCMPLPEAPVVAKQMEQLLVNLIGNALKFSSSYRTPEVWVQADIVPKESLAPELLNSVVHAERYLQLEVKDNGIGFDQEQSSRIFELFIRLHGYTEYEGTGIGLAMCRKVAENHGGYIDAFSEKGKGSCFVVTLPHS